MDDKHLTHLNKLNISGNFATKKNRTSLKNALEKLVGPDTYQSCPIQTLLMSGDPKDAKGQLKKDILDFVFSLMTNEWLLELDISFHGVGNELANALAKVLQVFCFTYLSDSKVNKTLKTLYWDGNGTTKTGFKKFFTGLQTNYTLEKMPLPHQDISLIDQKLDKLPPQTISNWNHLLQQIQEKLVSNSRKDKKISPPRHVMKRMMTLLDDTWRRVDESYNIPISCFDEHLEKLKVNVDPFTTGFDIEYNVSNCTMSSSHLLQFINQKTSGINYDYRTALDSENRMKNRYGDILARKFWLLLLNLSQKMNLQESS